MHRFFFDVVRSKREQRVSLLFFFSAFCLRTESSPKSASIDSFATHQVCTSPYRCSTRNQCKRKKRQEQKKGWTGKKSETPITLSMFFFFSPSTSDMSLSLFSLCLSLSLALLTITILYSLSGNIQCHRLENTTPIVARWEGRGRERERERAFFFSPLFW